MADCAENTLALLGKMEAVLAVPRLAETLVGLMPKEAGATVGRDLLLDKDPGVTMAVVGE